EIGFGDAARRPAHRSQPHALTGLTRRTKLDDEDGHPVAMIHATRPRMYWRSSDFRPGTPVWGAASNPVCFGAYRKPPRQVLPSSPRGRLVRRLGPVGRDSHLGSPGHTLFAFARPYPHARVPGWGGKQLHVPRR